MPGDDTDNQRIVRFVSETPDPELFLILSPRPRLNSISFKKYGPGIFGTSTGPNLPANTGKGIDLDPRLFHRVHPDGTYFSQWK